MSINQQLQDAMLAYSIDVTRFGVTHSNDVVRIMRELQADLVAQLRGRLQAEERAEAHRGADGRGERHAEHHEGQRSGDHAPAQQPRHQAEGEDQDGEHEQMRGVNHRPAPGGWLGNLRQSGGRSR